MHPEDKPEVGPWCRGPWDLIVDLGFAGPETYAEWSRKLDSRVLTIHEFASYPESYRRVNRFFDRGRGRLLDSKGLDWWEVLAMERYQAIHALYLFHQLRREIGGCPSELAATRPHDLSRIAQEVLGVPVHYFETQNDDPKQRVMRVLRSMRKLRVRQVVEIAFDKWDSGYHFRRHVTRHRRAGLTDPCILLPSAYSNVTRAVLAYASSLPDVKFLLLTTRKSAEPLVCPENVEVAPLAAYVQPSIELLQETTSLQKDWIDFAQDLQAEDEQFRCISNAGGWEYFPSHLSQGLRLRDAWSRVLQSEHVTGVLCGDDLNSHTRLPLILAKKNRLNAIYCSHGALDVGFLFKKPFADQYLVKGEMEKDYLERAETPVEFDCIYLGAPGNSRTVVPESRTQEAIVFFSQPYEVAGGRADLIYRSIIPRMYEIACQFGRQLIVKLHPFESVRARKELVNSVLGVSIARNVEVIGAVPAREVISRAWCGVTVDSSVAVECALSGVPVFLCAWLDFSGDGYVQQYARFGVGELLHTPGDIARIPTVISEFRLDDAKLNRLWREADPKELREIMSGVRKVPTNPCAC